MTEQQRTLARHALGLPNRNHTTYRNHFCTGAGSKDYEPWMQMVAQGDAIRTVSPQCGGNDIFFLTLQGALAARDPKEHLSRVEAADIRRRETQ